ncbi:MAG: DNA polymerase III subunit beta [Planctomycetota bacterium]
MKIRCNREYLSSAWTTVNAVVPPKPIRPVLSQIKLCASKDNLELYATDMDMGVKYTVPEAIIEEKGEALIPASLMGGILKDAWGEEVQIISKKDSSDVILPDSTFHILSDSVENYPGFPEFNGKNTFTLPGESFARMVELTRFAISREDTRYALNGIFIELKKGSVKMVSTDGRRLSCADTKLPKGVKTTGSAIAPVPGLDEIIRCFSEEEENVEISLSENMLQAKTKRATVFTKLIEGTFPNYEEVIPKGYEKKVLFDSDALLLRLRQAARLTSEESRAVKFSFKKGKLTMSSSSPEMGDATIEMAVKYEGEDIEIRFNPAYLVDVMRALPGKEITLELRESTKPGLITCGKDFLYVAMPVNVD